jgi:hypothetical protein
VDQAAISSGGGDGSSAGAGLRSPVAQLGVLAGAFALATLIAKVAGAGWGPALAFGQMAFAAALVAVLLRSP